MLATVQAIDPRANVVTAHPVPRPMSEPVRPAGATPAAAAAPSNVVSINIAWLAALDARVQTVRADRDEEVVAQEDPATWCYLVVSGCVRTTRLMEDGRRQVGEFLLPGDLFGWDSVGTHDFGAEAVTPVTLRRYPRRDIENLADRDPAVAHRLRDLARARSRSGRDHILLLGRKTAAEKIASFLLEMVSRLTPDGNGLIALPMSRADMGDYLGLTIETVCRRMTQLRQDGTIAVDGTRVAIRDRRALDAAGRDRVLH